MKHESFILLAAGLAVFTGCGDRGESRVRFDPEVPAHYAFRLPADYDSEEEYPLVIALHGHDMDESQPLCLWNEGFFYEPDFILLSVRAPFKGDDGFAWFKQKDDTLDIDPVARRKASVWAAETRILEILAEFEEDYRIDPDWRFLIGFSQGANLAFYVGLRNADIFQGVAGFSGHLDTFLLPPRQLGDIEEMEVFIALGRGEGVRAVEAVRNDKELLSKAGAEVRLYLYEGGHVTTASSCRAMQNFFDLALSRAPEDDFIYEEEFDDYDNY